VAPPLAAVSDALVERFSGGSTWPMPAQVETAGPLPSGPVQAGTVEALVEDARGTTIALDASHPAVLLVADTAGDPRSWSAWIDGLEAAVWRANLAYLAVPVTPGRHVVRLRYTPPGLAAGLGLMSAALLALAVACVVSRRTAAPA
jgi:hypothetical protein